MIEDRELNSWREQWSSVAEPPADSQRKVRQKIKRQDRLFVLGNVLTLVVFLSFLIFALYLRQQANSIGTGWGTGVCALAFLMAGIRIWVLRRTWRPETQSTRAFAELWRRRVESRIRLLRFSIYVSIGWIIFCVVLTAANWGTIGQDVRTHPRDWAALLVVCVLMQPVLWFGAARLRRRKLAELNEVTEILDQMK
jgi:hypothetical protein